MFKGEKGTSRLTLLKHGGLVSRAGIPQSWVGDKKEAT